MKKFIILISLILTTSSAFAESVTFSAEQIKKIETHITSLNTQIQELTDENKTLKAEIAEANKKINVPSDNAEGVVDNLTNSKDSDVVDTKPSNISCKQVGELAKNIMRHRQDGSPMSHVMEIADGNSVMIAMIQLAYSETRWSTDKSKTTAIQDFVIVTEQSCYSSGFENN